jgi:hypothetical protein
MTQRICSTDFRTSAGLISLMHGNKEVLTDIPVSSWMVRFVFRLPIRSLSVFLADWFVDKHHVSTLMCRI